MTSSIDFSIAMSNVLAAELDEISFGALTRGEALKLTISAADSGGTQLDSWTSTYYADEQGTITIHALATLWRAFILCSHHRDNANAEEPPKLMPGILVTIAYETESSVTAQCTRRVWYTREDVEGATVSWMSTLVPFLSKKKTTFADAKERFFIVGDTSRTIKAVTRYVTSGAEAGSTHTLSTGIQSDDFMRSTDVSPQRIAALLPLGASLREYTIQICTGSTVFDTCRYIVCQDHYAQRMEVAWLNRWGVYETLWLTGREQHKTGRKADYGYAGGHYTALDVERTDEYEQSAGRGSRDLAAQVRDLAASPDVWRYNHQRSLWQRITITGVDITQHTPTNEAQTAAITYRTSKKY